MSFGYYDKDWIDPPEDPYELADDYIAITFSGDTFSWEPTEEVIFDDDTFTEDLYNDDYYFFVIGADSLDEAVSVILEEMMKDYTPGRYALYGKARIDYEFWLPVGMSKYRNEYDDYPDIELHGVPDVTLSDIRIVPAK